MLWVALLRGWWQCDLDTRTQNDMEGEHWEVYLFVGIEVVDWHE